MVNTKGYRRCTRHLFARRFKHHGTEHLSTYLKVYKVGDIVDVKGHGAFHKGMPYKYYHGKTGKIFNVTKRAVGVILNKPIGNRIMQKRVNVRIEHVHPSRCREEFLQRVKANDEKKRQVKAAGAPRVLLKRQPVAPRPAHIVKTKGKKAELIEPIPYEILA